MEKNEDKTSNDSLDADSRQPKRMSDEVQNDDDANTARTSGTTAGSQTQQQPSPATTVAPAEAGKLPLVSDPVLGPKPVVLGHIKDAKHIHHDGSKNTTMTLFSPSSPNRLERIKAQQLCTSQEVALEPTPVYAKFKNKFGDRHSKAAASSVTTTTTNSSTMLHGETTSSHKQASRRYQTGTEVVATTPGAVAVSPSRPTRTCWSENDHDISDEERRDIENLDDTPQLASARLVDQDREEQLALENERLRQQIEKKQQQEQQQTHAVMAFPVLDDPPNKSYWKFGLAALLIIGAIAVVVVLVTLALQDEDSSPSLASAMDVIAAEPRLSTFYQYMQSTGLENVIRSGQLGTVTLFAPTNDAFATYLLQELRYQEARGVVHLRALLAKHIFQGRLSQTMMSDHDQIDMYNNETVNVSMSMENPIISLAPALESSYDVNVTLADIRAENGDVIHIMDGIIKPNFYDLSLYDIFRALNLSESAFSMVSDWAVQNMADPLRTNDITMLIPSNDAMSRFISGLSAEQDEDYVGTVFLVHVIRLLYPIELVKGSDSGVSTLDGEVSLTFTVSAADGSTTISLDNGSNAKVVLANQIFRNGMAHVIDQVLIP